MLGSDAIIASEVNEIHPTSCCVEKPVDGLDSMQWCKKWRVEFIKLIENACVATGQVRDESVKRFRNRQFQGEVATRRSISAHGKKCVEVIEPIASVSTRKGRTHC